MYVLIEGMPGTGKTTVARKLSSSLDLPYVKSVLSDTDFGWRLRELRDYGDPRLMEALYVGDLALDEIKVARLASVGGLVRDKSYASSVAHIRVHGYENTTPVAQAAVEEGYRAVSAAAVLPDLVIFLTANMEEVLKRLYKKKDVSRWDISLCSNPSDYSRQREELLRELTSRYADRLHVFDAGRLSVEDICMKVIKLAQGVLR